MAVLLTILVILLLLMTTEYLWRRNIIAGEYGRKIVHISAGMFIASWPYYLPTEAIIVLSIVAIVGLMLSKKVGIFKVIHDVSRLTAGEYLFPTGVLLAAVFAQADWIFSVAVLLMSLADGMAAVLGKKYGTLGYNVGRTQKSLFGTAAYLFFSYVSLAVGYMLGGSTVMQQNVAIVFVWLPILTGCLEAASPYGADNIAVPAAAIWILNSISV